MRVLIAGCGYVGTRVAAALAGAGHRVWGLSRGVRALPPEVQPVAADVTRPETLRALPAPLDAVAYLVSADGRGDAAYRDAYVHGVRNLLHAVHAGSPGARVLHVSSTGVYGHDDGREVDEGTDPRPDASTARLLREGEEVAASRSMPSVVLRLAGIYGPSRTRLIDRVRDGSLAIPRDRWTNRIHADDAAAAVVHLLQRRDPEPLYLGVDSEPALLSHVAAWLATRLGVPAPAAAGGEPPAGKRCRSDRLLASGFRLRYPSYREGYHSLLAEIA